MFVSWIPPIDFVGFAFTLELEAVPIGSGCAASSGIVEVFGFAGPDPPLNILLRIPPVGLCPAVPKLGLCVCVWNLRFALSPTRGGDILAVGESIGVIPETWAMIGWPADWGGADFGMVRPKNSFDDGLFTLPVGANLGFDTLALSCPSGFVESKLILVCWTGCGLLSVLVGVSAETWGVELWGLGWPFHPGTPSFEDLGIEGTEPLSTLRLGAEYEGTSERPNPPPREGMGSRPWASHFVIFDLLRLSIYLLLLIGLPDVIVRSGSTEHYIPVPISFYNQIPYWYSFFSHIDTSITSDSSVGLPSSSRRIIG